MDWTILDNGDFRGLETFFDDGTAIDIIEYGGSGDWCWMIRVPVEDDAITHEVYASYDDGAYFSDMCSALDAAMGYIERFFPALSRETIQYASDRKRAKFSLLRAAAAAGLVAVFSTSIAFGTVSNVSEYTGFETYATIEQATSPDDDSILFGHDPSGNPAYLVGGETDPVTKNALDAAGIDSKSPSTEGFATLAGDSIDVALSNGKKYGVRVPDHLKAAVRSAISIGGVECESYQISSAQAARVAESVPGSFVAMGERALQYLGDGMLVVLGGIGIGSTVLVVTGIAKSRKDEDKETAGIMCLLSGRLPSCR